MHSADYIARLTLLVLILAVNAFFAASEVALLSVRDSRLRHLAAEGSAGARMALSLLANPEKLLSVTQVGVTLASLGLGWAGEDTLFLILTAIFRPVVPTSFDAVFHAVAFVLAFVVMSYGHVVIGEVVPKKLAIDRADRLAITVAPVLMLFYRLSSLFITIVERSANAISRALGVRENRSGHGHSLDELKLIVSSSRFAGHIPELQENMIHKVLDLEETSVREIMQPRHEIVSVSVDASLDEVLSVMVTSQHSRLPVWRDAPEHLVGILFFKDMVRLWHDRRAHLRTGRPSPRFAVDRTMRKPLIAPETKPLVQMLDDFRHSRAHMALVVDEFGTVTGLVTVEDVLEQIVGEITDEFDETLVEPEAAADHAEIDGSTTVRDLAETYGVELPSEEGFETVAGYILYKLGRIPAIGEVVDYEDRRFEVLEMDRNRIARVRMEKIAVENLEDTPAAAAFGAAEGDARSVRP